MRTTPNITCLSKYLNHIILDYLNFIDLERISRDIVIIGLSLSQSKTTLIIIRSKTFSFFPLAESPQLNLQITAYK